MHPVYLMVFWSSVAFVFASDWLENGDAYNYSDDDYNPAEEYNFTEENNLTEDSDSADYSRAEETYSLSKEAGIRSKIKNKIWGSRNTSSIDILWPHGRPGTQTKKKPGRKPATSSPAVSVTTTQTPFDKLSSIPTDTNVEVSSAPLTKNNWFLVGVSTPVPTTDESNQDGSTEESLAVTHPPKDSGQMSVETFQISLVEETSQEMTTELPPKPGSVVEMNPSSGEIPASLLESILNSVNQADNPASHSIIGVPARRPPFKKKPPLASSTAKEPTTTTSIPTRSKPSLKTTIKPTKKVTTAPPTTTVKASKPPLGIWYSTTTGTTTTKPPTTADSVRPVEDSLFWGPAVTRKPPKKTTPAPTTTTVSKPASKPVYIPWYLTTSQPPSKQISTPSSTSSTGGKPVTKSPTPTAPSTTKPLTTKPSRPSTSKPSATKAPATKPTTKRTPVIPSTRKPQTTTTSPIPITQPIHLTTWPPGFETAPAVPINERTTAKPSSNQWNFVTGQPPPNESFMNPSRSPTNKPVPTLFPSKLISRRPVNKQPAKKTSTMPPTTASAEASELTTVPFMIEATPLPPLPSSTSTTAFEIPLPFFTWFTTTRSPITKPPKTTQSQVTESTTTQSRQTPPATTQSPAVTTSSQSPLQKLTSSPSAQLVTQSDVGKPSHTAWFSTTSRPVLWPTKKKGRPSLNSAWVNTQANFVLEKLKQSSANKTAVGSRPISAAETVTRYPSASSVGPSFIKDQMASSASAEETTANSNAQQHETVASPPQWSTHAVNIPLSPSSMEDNEEETSENTGGNFSIEWTEMASPETTKDHLVTNSMESESWDVFTSSEEDLTLPLLTAVSPISISEIPNTESAGSAADPVNPTLDEIPRPLFNSDLRPLTTSVPDYDDTYSPIFQSLLDSANNRRRNRTTVRPSTTTAPPLPGKIFTPVTKKPVPIRTSQPTTTLRPRTTKPTSPRPTFGMHTAPTKRPPFLRPNEGDWIPPQKDNNDPLVVLIDSREQTDKVGGENSGEKEPPPDLVIYTPIKNPLQPEDGVAIVSEDEQVEFNKDPVIFFLPSKPSTTIAPPVRYPIISNFTFTPLLNDVDKKNSVTITTSSTTTTSTPKPSNPPKVGAPMIYRVPPIQSVVNPVIHTIGTNPLVVPNNLNLRPQLAGLPIVRNNIIPPKTVVYPGGQGNQAIKVIPSGDVVSQISGILAANGILKTPLKPNNNLLKRPVIQSPTTTATTPSTTTTTPTTTTTATTTTPMPVRIVRPVLSGAAGSTTAAPIVRTPQNPAALHSPQWTAVTTVVNTKTATAPPAIHSETRFGSYAESSAAAPAQTKIIESPPIATAAPAIKEVKSGTTTSTSTKTPGSSLLFLSTLLIPAAVGIAAVSGSSINRQDGSSTTADALLSFAVLLIPAFLLVYFINFSSVAGKRRFTDQSPSAVELMNRVISLLDSYPYRDQ